MILKAFRFFSSIKIFFVISTLISMLLVYDTVFNKKESIVSSILFLLLCVALMLNIFSCAILRVISGLNCRKSFYLIHFGIVVVILGFILSSFFRFESEIGLKKNEKTDAAEFNGYIYKLPFALKLNSFKIEYYKPPELFISFANKKYPCKSGIKIKNGDDIYMVEKCFRDFSMNADGNYYDRTDYFNNPAALVIANNREKNWLFLNKQSHFNKSIPLVLGILNDEIKNFKSEIEVEYKGKIYNRDVYVNMPINFDGYKIYQTGYDPSYGEYSIITLKRDRWAWVVFVGFVFISLGVVLWIF